MCPHVVGDLLSSRPGEGWHAGHFEGVILQCKEKAVVRASSQEWPRAIPVDSAANLAWSLLRLKRWDGEPQPYLNLNRSFQLFCFIQLKRTIMFQFNLDLAYSPSVSVIR